MEITVTLGYALTHCNDWEYFCEKEGYDVWAVSEGAKDVEVTLTKDKAVEYGLL